VRVKIENRNQRYSKFFSWYRSPFGSFAAGYMLAG
jgi:hypothetical protein